MQQRQTKKLMAWTRQSDTGQREKQIFIQEVMGHMWRRSGTGSTIVMVGKHHDKRKDQG